MPRASMWMIGELMRDQCEGCGSHLEGETGLCPDCHVSVRFALVPAVGPVIPLHPGEVLTFGRSSDCTIPIHDRAVSRLHAEVGWRESQPELRDKSRHGTLVNGRPVEAQVLESDDLVRIGGFQCTVLDRSVDGSQPPRSKDTIHTDGAVLQGCVTAGSLPEVLQSLALGRRTGRLHVSSQLGERFWIALREGAPVAAASGESGLTGLKAALALLATSSGRFLFCEEEEWTDPPEFHLSLMSLLLEALRPEKHLETIQLPPSALVQIRSAEWKRALRAGSGAS